MATIAVPTLSAAGWVFSLGEKIDKLMSHFVNSDSAQSQLYPGHVANLPYLVRRYGHDETALVRECRRTLELYLGRYFPEGVNVEVTYDNQKLSDSGQIDLRIAVDVLHEGQRYSVGALLETDGTSFKSYVQMNNQLGTPNSSV